MRIVIAALAFVVSVQAGTIKGVVLEYASSRPISRTLVRLDPMPQPGGGRGRALQTRAGHAGQFVFADAEPGVYLLEAVREGFFPAAHGQRFPAGWAIPVEVTNTSLLVASLRLRHKGALTGQVLDENGVGMAGVGVVAYRARLPLRVAGRGESDDRGTYRIAGLDAGKYWVRSAEQAFDDGSEWLPTFAPRGEELREALPYDVLVDTDTKDVDIQPEEGTLFDVGGRVDCYVPGPVTVTLSSETGRRATEASCRGGYLFEGVAAGDYEIFAELRDGSAAGFIEYSVRRKPPTCLWGRCRLSRLRCTMPAPVMRRIFHSSCWGAARICQRWSPRASSKGRGLRSPPATGRFGRSFRRGGTWSQLFNSTVNGPANRRMRMSRTGIRSSFRPGRRSGSESLCRTRQAESQGRW